MRGVVLAFYALRNLLVAGSQAVAVGLVFRAAGDPELALVHFLDSVLEHGAVDLGEDL